MHIHTSQVIIDYNVKDVTFTNLFIKSVDSMADEQGIKKINVQ